MLIALFAIKKCKMLHPEEKIQDNFHKVHLIRLRYPAWLWRIMHVSPADATPPSRAADFEITKHENPHRCAGRWPAIAAAAMTPRASPLWRLRAVTTGSVRSRDGGN